ncbi:MAG: RNA polymerase sigma factor [Chloroflexi bacterium]|nr:RNA polymerase sigma factor [Chloroflexota bacterium]
MQSESDYCPAEPPEIEEFEAVFCSHKDMVLRTAYLMLGNTQEAEDALQEIFVKLFRARSAYNPEKGKFKTWLYRVTVNHCISHCRKKRLRTFSLEAAREATDFDPPDVSSRTPEEMSLARERNERVRKAVQSLEPKHRAVVVLRYFDDLSYDEIAHALEIPLGTVKSRLNLAIKDLRRRFPDGQHPYEL